MAYYTGQYVPFKGIGHYPVPDYDGPYTYSWTFDDGGTATGQYAVHKYHTPGNHTTSVVCVNTSLGQTAYNSITDNIIQTTITVSINPTGGATLENVDIQYDGTAICNFADAVLGYSWSFDDGDSSLLQNPTHTWTTTGAHVATLTVTDSVTDTTGSKTSTVFVYPSAGWNVMNGVSLPRHFEGSLCCQMADGRMLIAGGWVNGSRVNSAYIFDGIAFTPIASMNDARATSTGPNIGYNSYFSDSLGGNAVLLNDGRIFIVGYSPTSTVAEIYNPVSNSWSSVSLPTSIIGVYELYPPNNNSYSLLMIPPVAKHHSCLMHDGKVMLYGGTGGSSFVGGEVLTRHMAYITLFDPSSNSFISLDPLGSPTNSIFDADYGLQLLYSDLTNEYLYYASHFGGGCGSLLSSNNNIYINHYNNYVTKWPGVYTEGVQGTLISSNTSPNFTVTSVSRQSLLGEINGVIYWYGQIVSDGAVVSSYLFSYNEATHAVSQISLGWTSTSGNGILRLYTDSHKYVMLHNTTDSTGLATGVYNTQASTWTNYSHSNSNQYVDERACIGKLFGKLVSLGSSNDASPEILVLP